MSEFKTIVVVNHAAFRPERRAGLDRVLAGLGDLTRVVYNDERAAGSLGPWLIALRLGLELAENMGATHITSLPDDAILPPGFPEALMAAIAAQPKQILCFQANHRDAPLAAAKGCSWYTTHEGFTGFGGTMPVDVVKEFLAWRHNALLHPDRDAQKDPNGANGDEAVNLFAMNAGMLIYKALPSLVDHDLTLPSLDGHDAQNNDPRYIRRPTVATRDARGLTFDGPVEHLGKSYDRNHWGLFWKIKPAQWNIEAAYLAERNGEPVSETPHVLIATPAYQPPELAYLESVSRMMADLNAHGIKTSHFVTPGDSAVTRGRHCISHAFLQSQANYLLQWDADVECLDATAVRAMIESDKGIIGGAYPFRDGSGHVCANMLPEDLKRQEVSFEGPFLRVAEVGTGFLLTKRSVIVDMMKRHPELLYECDLPGLTGTPLWALFDFSLEMKANGRRRYATEDWRFCSLARADGHDVWVYFPPKFRHWGKTGHEGHIATAWKMRELPKAEAAA